MFFAKSIDSRQWKGTLTHFAVNMNFDKLTLDFTGLTAILYFETSDISASLQAAVSRVNVEIRVRCYFDIYLHTTDGVFAVTIYRKAYAFLHNSIIGFHDLDILKPFYRLKLGYFLIRVCL